MTALISVISLRSIPAVAFPAIVFFSIYGPDRRGMVTGRERHSCRNDGAGLSENGIVLLFPFAPGRNLTRRYGLYRD